MRVKKIRSLLSCVLYWFKSTSQFTCFLTRSLLKFSLPFESEITNSIRVEFYNLLLYGSILWKFFFLCKLSCWGKQDLGVFSCHVQSFNFISNVNIFLLKCVHFDFHSRGLCDTNRAVGEKNFKARWHSRCLSLVTTICYSYVAEAPFEPITQAH